MFLCFHFSLQYVDQKLHIVNDEKLFEKTVNNEEVCDGWENKIETQSEAYDPDIFNID